VEIQSALVEFRRERVRAILADLPRAAGYRLIVKPLRYRTAPHLQGLCDYLHHVLGRKGSAETACDRFALAHFRSRPHT